MLELKTNNQETQLAGREVNIQKKHHSNQNGWSSSLHSKERKLLWDRMVWGPRQELIERFNNHPS